MRTNGVTRGDAGGTQEDAEGRGKRLKRGLLLVLAIFFEYLLTRV